MSYRCEICGEAKKGQPRIVPTGFRKANYPKRYAEIEGKTVCIDEGGTGMEIAGEVKICADCPAPKVNGKK